MMWRTHYAIGAIAPIVVGDLFGILPAVVGSVAPDYLEKLPLLLGGKPIEHRTKTHILLYWVGAVAVGFALANVLGSFLMWWAWGGLTHVLADMFTPTGVPLTPNSRHRTNLLGGRIRTGSSSEYILIGCIVVVATLALRGGGVGGGGDYVPFFPDWYGRFDDGLIDKYELKSNRLKFF